MRNLVKGAIEPYFEVVGEAADGETAIDMILELNPDLVTLDNILPDMIGTDICKTINEDGGFTGKVIMISAVGQESIIQEGKDNGATDYIIKPFTNDDVKDVLEKNNLI